MRIFADLLHVVNAHVFNGTGAVPEALDVEVHDFNAQLFHVRHHVFRDLLGHALAVLHHFLQAYGAHDFTHVSFQNLGHQGDEFALLHVEQSFRRAKEQGFVRRDLDVGHAVHADVDKFIGRHGLGGLDVHLHHPQGDPVHPLEEGDPPTGLANENTAFAETGNDVGGIRGRFEITADQQHDAQKQHNASYDVTDIIHVHTS